MSHQSLTAFRTRFPDCEAVVLADISARTVLAWDSALRWPQEQLDMLCDLAAEVLLTGAEGTAPLRRAMLCDPLGIRVFAGAHADATEVICAVFPPGCDVDGVAEAAEALCAGLAASDVLS